MSQSIPFARSAEGVRRTWRDRSELFTSERALGWYSFVIVTGFAFALNAWGLSRNGLGNTYYAAAVRSMSESWHHFFFASFDPGGFITVDKPPVFLWVGALTVRVFGYSSWSLLLPSAVAGAATVALVWLMVRRYFGVSAATVAGLVLALTPISVAVDRLNLPEPFYILALVGAAWAVLHSIDSRRWWAWIALAGLLVGIAFNTKMLAAWIPGPALALAAVAGMRHWRPALKQVPMRLGLLAVVTFLASASWMVVVDAWPASSRPYVGGSSDNSVSNLALDYNGLGRVDGSEAAGPGGARAGTAPANGGFPQGGSTRQPGGLIPPGANNVAPGGGGTFPGFNRAGGTGPGFGNRGNSTTQFPGPGGNPGGLTGAGGIIAGTPGWLRMFDDANGGQIGWFLPFALLGGVLCLWYWRKDHLRRAAIVLFLGWVLLFGLIFSFAQGIYHSYYTSALAPGIAIMSGMTFVALVGLVRRNSLWLLAVGALVGVSLWVQLSLSGRFPDFRSEMRPAGVVLAVAGFVLLTTLLRTRWSRLAPVGMAAIVGGLLLLPGSWATYELTSPSLNATLPQAGPREGTAGRSFGSQSFDSGTAALAAWLIAHQDPQARWDLAVTSAQSASTLVAEYELSVMPLGGFSGSDPTITVAQFADLVANGEVRYVEVGSGFGGPGGGGFRGFGAPGGGNPGGLAPGAAAATDANGPARGAAAVTSAAQSVCTAVTASDLPSQYQGTLYDCAGKSDALRARQ